MARLKMAGPFDVTSAEPSKSTKVDIKDDYQKQPKTSIILKKRDSRVIFLFVH